MKLPAFPERRRKRAETLYDDARELIEVMDYDGALAIGAKLRKLRFSGAFEIEGLAYSGLDRSEDAVRVLREGLALAPSAWPNWLLLGSCLSDLGRYGEAFSAYDAAEACPEADPSVINLNRAIVASRSKDHESTLRYLDHLELDEPEAQLRAIAYRVMALQALGQDAEAEDLSSRTLSDWRETHDGAGKGDIGMIMLALGKIGLARGDDRAVLRAGAVDSWRATHHAPLLWLIREVQPTCSPEAQYFRLMLHGTMLAGSNEDIDAQGFFTSVDVVADSPEEALALFLELDPPDPGVEVTIEEASAVEPRPDEPRGVYAVRGRIYYRDT